MTVERESLKKKGSHVDAIQAEAKATSKLGKWGTFLDVMALATVLKRPLFSVNPLFEGNKGIRPLLNGLLQPPVTNKKDSGEAFYILWSREGEFDNRPGVVFQPNHFVPVISHLSSTQPGMTASKDTTYILKLRLHPRQAGNKESLHSSSMENML